MTLSGQGFSDAMTAEICGVACEVKMTTSTDFECRTPANSGKWVISYMNISVLMFFALITVSSS